jgi:hypothetical protein
LKGIKVKVIYRYFAVKPIRAEHPIGSGIIVEYQPGDEVPGNDWGRATDNLVELGKIARVAFNVEDDTEVEVELGPAAVDIKALHVAPPKPKRGPGRPRKVKSA